MAVARLDLPSRPIGQRGKPTSDGAAACRPRASGRDHHGGDAGVYGCATRIEPLRQAIPSFQGLFRRPSISERLAGKSSKFMIQIILYFLALGKSESPSPFYRGRGGKLFLANKRRISFGRKESPCPLCGGGAGHFLRVLSPVPVPEWIGIDPSCAEEGIFSANGRGESPPGFLGMGCSLR